MDSFENLGCDITFPPTAFEQMQRLLQTYVAVLTQDLDERFATSFVVISALGIFDPLCVPNHEADGFQEYRAAQVNILAKYIFKI